MKRWELQECKECKGIGELKLIEHLMDVSPQYYKCPICKGTGYIGLIIYDSICASLFLSKECCNKQGLLSVSKDVRGTVAFLTEDVDGCQYIKDSIFITAPQLQEVIKYREGEPWCTMSKDEKISILGLPSRKASITDAFVEVVPEWFWHKNLSILADTAEEAGELINACRDREYAMGHLSERTRGL